MLIDMDHETRLVVEQPVVRLVLPVEGPLRKELPCGIEGLHDSVV
jgi:hypothetical protein